MRININFTIDVPNDGLPALRELAGEVDTNEKARMFVKGDAQDYVIQYLEDNGVKVTIARDVTTTY